MLNEDLFIQALQEARAIISGAEKKDTSYFSCLRNYYNQYCHDDLRRDYAIDALDQILGEYKDC